MDLVVVAHNQLFMMQMIYSFIVGVYAAWLSASSRPLSGNFFGTIAVYSLLNVVIFLIGLFLLFNGYNIADGGRTVIYVLYMLFLVVILPGIFSVMQGRDDRSAGIIFGVSAMFNAAVSFSMMERGLASWVMTL